MSFAVRPTVPRGVRVAGELDMAVTDDFLAAARAAARGPDAFVVDLSDLEFIDSRGIGAIVAFAKEIRGDVVLLHPRPPVRRVIELTGVVGRVGIRVEPEATDAATAPTPRAARSIRRSA
jgi:anti-anti-sigma factor